MSTSALSDSDLKIARKAFSQIVDDDPSRALRLEPVLRWPTGAWEAFTDTLRESGFDRRRLSHLAALQWLIDQACEAAEKGRRNGPRT